MREARISSLKKISVFTDDPLAPDGKIMSKREGRGRNHGGKKGDRDKTDKREGITEF